MASEVTIDLRFEISNLNYPGIHMPVAPNSHFGCLRGNGGLKTASEVTSDLKFELSDLNYLCCHAFLACKSFPEMIPTDQLSSIDLRATPQVKKHQ